MYRGDAINVSEKRAVLHVALRAPRGASIVVNGENGGAYLGTLENNGVGLAPYHEQDADVPQELKDEIEALKAEIIAGNVTVS